jgi:two-component system osmolarity sensor histidine kinase EnvZ
MLKRLLPKTLFGRSLAIVATPLVLLQIVVAYVFYEAHWDTVTRRLALGLAGDISMVIQSLREAPDTVSRERVLGLARSHFALDVSVLPQEVLPSSENQPRPFGILDRMLNQALGERLFRPFAIDTRRSDNKIEIRVQLQEGVLQVLTQRKRLASTTTDIFVLWMVGTSIILLGVAVLFLRNQMRPIRALAQAADAFGKGRDPGDLKPSGATEVRQATTAFLAMRERMNRQMSQRTEMLAGVSHDLRTPLTRMKLQLEMLEDTVDVDNLRADVRDMETMVEGYLAFARGQDTERPVITDLQNLLAGVVDDARRAGKDVALEASGNMAVPLRPNALKRCITNLVDNAFSYAGAGAPVAVSARRRGEMIEIAIDDEGPGIPAEQREDAFKPFTRLDPARNPEKAGVGLGLTIARDIARGHGGDLTLEDGPRGGLRALVRLPV